MEIDISCTIFVGNSGFLKSQLWTTISQQVLEIKGCWLAHFVKNFTQYLPVSYLDTNKVWPFSTKRHNFRKLFLAKYMYKYLLVVHHLLQVCSNLNTCFCDKGWTGIDCSIEEILPTSTVASMIENSTSVATENGTVRNSIEDKMQRKEISYGKFGRTRFTSFFRFICYVYSLVHLISQTKQLEYLDLNRICRSIRWLFSKEN